MKKRFKRLGAALLSVALLMGSAGAVAQYKPVDPTDPYLPPVSGMFHEQKIDADGIKGQYSVYIPAGFEPCTDGVMVLTPDGMSAKGFLETEEGKAWKALSDEQNIATVYVEPQNAGTWNLTLSDGARDDQAFLKKVFDTLRSKSGEITAVLDMDERAFYLVGYEEGGTAAHEFSMKWPAIICGAASVGGSAVPADVIDRIGNELSYPFAQADNLGGREENAIPNREVPVPMWIVESAQAADNSDAVEAYWVAANSAEKAEANAFAQTVYENDQQRVWVTTGEKASKITPAILYEEFLSKVQRFVGDPCGRLEWTVEHTNNGKSGFFQKSEMIDGKQRRWMIYVPSSYQAGNEVPLVVAIHGYSSAMTAFTGDSRWQDVAEENGFIVAFAQGYPTDNIFGNIPVPFWNNEWMGIPVEDVTDDVEYFREVVAQTKAEYSIDETRVYATGHSNGSCMTWLLAMEANDIFAAFAPVGSNMGAYQNVQRYGIEPVPVWNMKGEYDGENGAKFEPGTSDVQTIEYWVAYNGADQTPEIAADSTGRYMTREYRNADGVPLVRYTGVKNSPHAYLPEEAEMIWEDFFSKITLNQDGSRSYEGKKIERKAMFDDIAGHWGRATIEKAVEQGLFSGTSETTFSPNASVTRGMAVTVLGRAERAVGAPVYASERFSDVEYNAYYAPYVGWAAQKGVVNGIGADTYMPEQPVTREQLAVMIAGYAEKTGKQLPKVNAAAAYADDAQISSWAADAVAKMQTSGIMTGKGNNTFDPRSALTRAELAVVMQRVMELN